MSVNILSQFLFLFSSGNEDYFIVKLSYASSLKYLGELDLIHFLYKIQYLVYLLVLKGLPMWSIIK
jgi:hypothetical protein